MTAYTEHSVTTYRTATLEDLDALRRFEQEIIAAERAFDPTLRTGRIEYYDLERMLEADDVRFVVAQSGQELIACGFARIDKAKRYLSHSSQAYLGLMYVDPKHRRRSINGEILERLKKWSLERGVTELRLEVYADNLAAVRAYEKAGFSRHILEMRLRVKTSAVR
jgi:RimJ/RimL family protein N-acetyltransferase